jgi:hypothetical protein
MRFYEFIMLGKLIWENSGEKKFSIGRKMFEVGSDASRF